jgi:hypothetical protein
LIRVEGAQLIPSKLEKWIHDRIFENLNDFDDHLNNVSLDWLENVGLVI